MDGAYQGGKQETGVRKTTGRNSVEKAKIYHAREHTVPNKANFGIKNDNIGGENSLFGRDSHYILD